MEVIKTYEGIEITPFYNMLDCPYRPCCPKREKVEEGFITRNGKKLHCSWNDKMVACEEFQGLNKKSNVNLKKLMSLEYL